MKAVVVVKAKEVREMGCCLEALPLTDDIGRLRAVLRLNLRPGNKNGDNWRPFVRCGTACRHKLKLKVILQLVCW